MPPILPKKTWLERFATHLRLLRPQLSTLEAAYVAMDEFVACDFDPRVAAAMYAEELTGEASTSVLASVAAPRWATGRLIVERGLIWCGGEGVARRRESEANLLRL